MINRILILFACVFVGAGHMSAEAQKAKVEVKESNDGSSAVVITNGKKVVWTEHKLLEEFQHEPKVQDVQDAAIRYYQVHPDRIRRLIRNARLKGLIPSVGGSFSNGVHSRNRLMEDGFYRDALPFKEKDEVTGDSHGFSVRADWQLDRLLFNAEVLDVQSLIGILDGIVREVTTIYYIRRRLQIDMILRPPPDLATRISQTIRIEELTGLLDAMTGNFMTRKVTEGLHKRKLRESKSQLVRVDTVVPSAELEKAAMAKVKERLAALKAAQKAVKKTGEATAKPADVKKEATGEAAKKPTAKLVAASATDKKVAAVKEKKVIPAS